MFSFKRLLGTEKIGIIDIWTYKIKVVICEVKWTNLKVLWYWEKRQEINDILHWEISNISWVSKSIKDALLKASKKAWAIPKNIILNIPSSHIIPELNEINYKRQQISRPIDMEELDNIISKTEEYSLKKAQNDILRKTWYSSVDVKLVTSSITKILIDWRQVTNPIWFTGENVNTTIMNIFTPSSKFNTVKSIWKALNKKIKYIIPSEFAIPKITEKTTFAFKDIIFLDIWSTKTRIIIQKEWSLIWFNILDIWIDDLIRKVSENYKQTRTEIIHNLNNNLYEEEKTAFLEVWKDWVFFAIKEISWTEKIPENLYVSWGWWVNTFIREYLTSETFSKSLYLKKPLKIINERVKYELMENIWECWINFWEYSWKELWTSIISLMIATSEIINLKEDIVINTLKKALEKIRI